LIVFTVGHFASKFYQLSQNYCFTNECYVFVILKHKLWPILIKPPTSFLLDSAHALNEKAVEYLNSFL